MQYNDSIYKRFHLEKAFTPDECQTIIDIEGEYIPSVVQNDMDLSFAQSSIRTSSAKQVFYEQQNYWLFKKLSLYTNQINKIYQFELDGIIGTQVIRYEEGQYYNWHSDMGAGLISTRKISLITLLTPPDEYEGGYVRWTPGFGPYPKEQGTLIIFPSYIPHKVEPVTRGTRYVLVAWVHGKKSFS